MMKLEIARGLFLVGSLGVASLAAAAWHEPGPGVLHSQLGKNVCSMPVGVKDKVAVRPDSDFLLLVFGLAQGGVR